jgi:hypothetical protein
MLIIFLISEKIHFLFYNIYIHYKYYEFFEIIEKNDDF